MRAQSNDVFLLDGVRTPFGKYRGAFRNLSAVELGQHAIAEIVRRHPQARHPSASLMGVVLQAGLGQNPARIAATRAGVEPTTPAQSLNSVCLASLEAVCDAARRIRAGEGADYLVGGFDSMSGSPLLIEPNVQQQAPVSTLHNDGLYCALAGASMGVLADRCNRELGVSRDEQDTWAQMSHVRAERTRQVRERDEIVPVDAASHVVTADQCVRSDTTIAKLKSLRPAFAIDGTITAGNASAMADGASVGLVVSASALSKYNHRPVARIVDWSWVAGPDFSLHLKPALAIRQVLERRKLRPAEIDLFEINEAFAGVAIASTKELGLALDVVNVNGGAIAIGHPLGATGFRLLLTLALELRRRGGRLGIAALCGGGGQGMAVLIENENLD